MRFDMVSYETKTYVANFRCTYVATHDNSFSPSSVSLPVWSQSDNESTVSPQAKMTNSWTTLVDNMTHTHCCDCNHVIQFLLTMDHPSHLLNRETQHDVDIPKCDSHDTVSGVASNVAIERRTDGITRRLQNLTL